MYNEAEKELKEWLKNESNRPLSSYGQVYPMFYTKVPVLDGFYYLYGGGLEGTQSISQVHYPLHFLGVYSKSQEKIYAEQRWFLERYPNMTDTRLLTDIVQEIEPSVNRCIEKILDNDRSKLEIIELSDEYKRYLENYKERELSDEYKKAIISGERSTDVKYRSEAYFGGWRDTVLLEYLENPAETVQKQAEAYIQKNQNNILLRFEKNDLLRAELRQLEQNPDERMERLHKVGQALSELKGKRVRISVSKNGEEVQFSWKADRFLTEFKFPAIQLSEGTWRTAMRIAQNGAFQAEDVVNISYHGKSWYSAEPYEPQQEQGPVQSM